jgi:dethiobiotin synthetase
MEPLVIISATGTDVGKTHVGEAFLLGYAPRSIAAYKPIETGVAPGAVGEDDRRLCRRATFHVKQRYTFVPPISPHRAAAEAGVSMDLAAILHDAAEARARSPLLVELAGGLYSPLALKTRNADLVTALTPTLHVLLAPNRLGVLHDVLVTLTAYPAIDAVLLNPAAATDASQPTNAGDLVALGVPCLGTLPRGTPEELASHPHIRSLIDRFR